MKFKIKAGDLAKGINPVLSVATKGLVKNYSQAFLVTIVAEDKRIMVLANGGRMCIENEISNHTCDNDPEYECFDEGSFTVRSSHIKDTLSSFDPESQICIEERSYSEDSDRSDHADENITATLKDGKEIVLTLASDEEEFQTMPCYNEHIEIPKNVTDFMKTQKDKDSITIRRDIFISAANRIYFARGFETFREQYLYWIIRHNKDLRFVVGTGSRFAVLSFEGKDLVKNSKNFDLLIPNEQTPVIIDILYDLADEYISFYRSDKHLIIKAGYFTAAIGSYVADKEWPDENKFLKRDSSCRFVTGIDDWLYAVKGIRATYSEEMKKEHDFHFAELTVDFDKEVLTAKTEGTMRSNRKIPIKNIEVKGPLENENNVSVSFVSQYLAEMVKSGDNNDNVQIEIDGPREVLILRYHANDSVDNPENIKINAGSSGISERFTIFFAPRKNK